MASPEFNVSKWSLIMAMRQSMPIRFEGKANLLLENLIIMSQPGEVGIELTKCPNVIIRNVIVTGGRTCIQLSGCIKSKILNADVGAYVNADEEGHGIQLRGCHDSLISKCSINRRGRGEDGINLFESTNSVVFSNRISHHGAATSGNGITVDKGCHIISIISNSLLRQGERGIAIEDGYRHIIYQNIVEDANYCIAVEGFYPPRITSDVRILDNVCRNFRSEAYYIDRETTFNIRLSKD